MPVARAYITVFIFLIAGSASPADFPGILHLRQWSTADGLPHNSVTTAIHSRSGYLWLGTAAGLARFDGVRFECFRTANSGLPNNHITALFESADGALWVGTDAGGLTARKDGNWESYRLSHGQIRAITQDWQGRIWIGTSFGLNMIGSDGIKVVTEDDGLADNIITALTIDHSGRLWIGTLRGGLAYFEAGVVFPCDYRRGLTPAAVTALHTDRLGNLWVGTHEGLFVLDQTDQLFRRIRGTGYTPATAIAEDPSGRIWIATMSDGIKSVAGDSTVSYTPDSGFPDEYVHTLFFDQDTSLWIGTDSHGLFQWLHRPVSVIPLDGHTVTALVSDRDENLLAGTRSAGLYRITGLWDKCLIEREHGLAGERITALHRDFRGCVWIVSEDAGLVCKDRSGFTTVVAPGERFAGTVNSITRDFSGTGWIGTTRGLYRFEENTISDPFLQEYDIRALLPAPEGNMYIGTSAGVLHCNWSVDTVFRFIPQTAGISVSSLFLLPGNELVIGTAGSGIYFLERDSLFHITTHNGLPDDHILSITGDGHANIWLGTSRGIVCLPDGEHTAFTQGASRYLKTIWFDDSDGMTTPECTAGIVRTKDDELFFATTSGIAHVNSREAGRTFNMIKPTIETHAPLHRENAGVLELAVTAFDYRAPDKLHFRYVLEGTDTGFRYLSPGSDRRIRYTALGSGDYRLIVQAAGNRSNWAEEPVVLSFTVPVPWYFSPVGISLLLAAAALITAGSWYYRKRSARIRATNKYRTIVIDPERTAGILDKLDRIMEQERLFLDPDLTITALARMLRIHVNQLSRIINEQHGIGFNDYVNRLRVATVRARLRDPENDARTITEIMYETGFNSKSVFNTAFKKFTGMTPTEFRRDQS